MVKMFGRYGMKIKIGFENIANVYIPNNRTRRYILYNEAQLNKLQIHVTLLFSKRQIVYIYIYFKVQVKMVPHKFMSFFSLFVCLLLTCADRHAFSNK